MKRSSLKRTTPLRTKKQWKPSRSEKPKTTSLAIRVAKLCGTSFKHNKKPSSYYRSEEHRRNVAALPCVSCGIEKRSQAAHLNFVELGKGMGIKLSDSLCVPLCADSFGRRGCHSLLDQGGVYDKATAKANQIEWLQATRTLLKVRSQWPEEVEADAMKYISSYLGRQS